VPDFSLVRVARCLDTMRLLKESGWKRRDALQQMVARDGVKLQVFYFAIGNADVYAIADFPDAATVVAFSMAINASGIVSIKTTLLLTPEEMQAATKRTIEYRAPGRNTAGLHGPRRTPGRWPWRAATRRASVGRRPN
jgi:uncharacterized protein with GYD domain